MKRSVKHILVSIVAAVALVSCEETVVVPDNNIGYDYMFDCLWTPDDHAYNQVELPAQFMNPQRPLYFTPDGKMVILEKAGDGSFRYFDDYSCLIDRGSNMMTISKGEQWYYFVIDRISETHSTLLYNGKDSEYVSFRRSAFPADSIDKSTFPDGWFDI